MTYGSGSDDNGSKSEASGQQLGLPAVLAPFEARQPDDGKRKAIRHHCNVEGCNASFPRPWRLERHQLAVHCGEASFKCDFDGCTKSYSSRCHLMRHKKTAHSGGLTPSKLYKCPHEGCSAVLKTNQNLKKHVKRAHNSSKECPECGKRFFKTVHLKYHMQYHTGEFLHECEPCGLKFGRKTEYNRHMRGHNIYLCFYPGCTLAFPRWTAARKHLRTHKPRFICYYCRKPSLHKGSFRFHVLSHLPDQPKRMNILKEFTCYYCNSNIRGKQSLRRHMRVMHFNKKVGPKKPKKPRKPRKDIGSLKPVVAFSSQLSGVHCCGPLSKALIGSYVPILKKPSDIIEAIEENLIV